MSNRIRNRHVHRGHGTLIVAFATLLAALSMFFASAVDVRAMLTSEGAALRAAKHEPVKMPEEWVWRGREPISLEYMYANHEKPRHDYIVNTP
jgi:hypothetical protein